MSLSSKAIGGYFELELARNKTCFYPNAKKYKSARSAFYALLIHIKPAVLWMPYYICESMIAPLKKAKIKINFYELNLDLSIKDNFSLKENEYLLYVNYFGVCVSIQEDILKKHQAEKVIFDHSQAFFEPPKSCLATIYSPRKFFGVPDGGLLITSLDISEPLEIDTESLNRASHLLKRLAGEPEDGYQDFIINDETLNDFDPKKMSFFTERILSSIDYQNVREIRNSNFQYLREKLDEKNKLKINLKDIDGPMGYPFLTENNDLKEKLIKSRVFIPTYWPGVNERKYAGNSDFYLIKHLNLLPCDQRYNIDDLKIIMELIDEY